MENGPGNPASSRPGEELQGYAPGRARRTQILATATELFGERGYRSTSLREIAARCGISHSGILHHFATKEDLLVAVLEERDREDTTAFEARVASWQDAVDLLFHTVQENVSSRRGVVEMFVMLSAEATSPDHPAHAYFVERYERARSTMASGYRLAAREGVLRKDIDPDTAAEELVALMDGLQLQWVLSGHQMDIASPLRQFLESQRVDPKPTEH